MRETLKGLLCLYLSRAGLTVGRVAQQSGIPKQTLYNWHNGRMPRWHVQLPIELSRLARALGLNSRESESLLIAAGCPCAVDKPICDYSIAGSLEIPNGWWRAGCNVEQYEMGIDRTIRHREYESVQVRSRRTKAAGLGILMQSCQTSTFSNRRIRLSSLARSENVEGWAGLWLRVDESGSVEAKNFDDMQDRPIYGTNDWAEYSVVLDVGDAAVGLAYGILLCGSGAVWIANLCIEPVGPEVPSTNRNVSEGMLPEKPINLDFKVGIESAPDCSKGFSPTNAIRHGMWGTR